MVVRIKSLIFIQNNNLFLLLGEMTSLVHVTIKLGIVLLEGGNETVQQVCMMNCCFSLFLCACMLLSIVFYDDSCTEHARRVKFIGGYCCY